MLAAWYYWIQVVTLSAERDHTQYICISYDVRADVYCAHATSRAIAQLQHDSM